MYVAGIWKQVMFNLEIETTGVPGQEKIFSCKIRSGSQLMNGPFIFYNPVCIRQRLFCSFHYMRHLKNGTHNNSGCYMHGAKTKQNLPPGEIGKNQRQRKDDGEIEYFGCNQFNQLNRRLVPLFP